MSELKNLEAELADLRRRRDGVQKRIDQAGQDYQAGVKIQNRRQQNQAQERLNAAQAEQAQLDSQLQALTGRISSINDASAGRIQAGRETAETTRRGLLDEAPKPFTQFYEDLRQDLPLPPANFLPAALAGGLYGLAKLPTIPSNWIGRGKASAALKEAQGATDTAAKMGAMNRAEALADQHGFQYRPTLKDAPMMAAAGGTGAITAFAPTGYDMMLPDVNQEKIAALAAAKALDDADPRKAAAFAEANEMPDKNPARQAAFDRLNDPMFWFKQPVLGALEGVAGYEAADLVSKGLRFPFKNVRAEVDAYKRNSSMDNAAGVYEARLAEKLAATKPTKADVSRALGRETSPPATALLPEPTGNPVQNVPPIPPAQPPALPPPAAAVPSNRRGPFPLNPQEQSDLQAQLTQMLSNSKLPGLAVGLPVAGAAAMGGASDASAAPGVNPLVLYALEELRRRGLLAEPDTAPGLLGGR